MGSLTYDFKLIKVGLLITLLSLMFGIGMGVLFGVNESSVKGYIAQGIEKNPEVHDKKSQSKIWRYAQRSHFHATGIASYSLVLLLIILLSKMKSNIKKISSTLVGVGTLYPLSWFSMFILAPSIGRSAAHDHIFTTSIVFISVASIFIALVIICASLFFDKFNESN